MVGFDWWFCHVERSSFVLLDHATFI